MPRPKRMSDGPIVLPKRWPGLVEGLDETKAGEIETCIHRSRPFGDAGKPERVRKTGEGQTRFLRKAGEGQTRFLRRRRIGKVEMVSTPNP